MKSVVTIIVAVFLVAVMAGCATDGGRIMGQSLKQHRLANTGMINSLIDDSIGNAIISQHTIFPYHYVADSPQLNELGRRDLRVLANHYKDHVMPYLSGEIVMERVAAYFDYDKADIREDAIPVLNEAIRALRQNPDTELLITGRADIRGTEDYNERLGTRRADAVRRYLVSRGIDDSRIRMLSRGELDALAPVTDAEGMQEDRHAEFMVARGTDGYPVKLNVRQGSVPKQLYEARVKAVVQFLREAGVDTGIITVGDDFPAGKGMPSERVYLILTETEEQTTGEQPRSPTAQRGM